TRLPDYPIPRCSCPDAATFLPRWQSNRSDVAEFRSALRPGFGGSMPINEQQHDRRGLPLVDTTLQDLRYGLRALRKNPAYSLVAIATLAIGIGAGTAVFSIASAVLLRPLPYGDPGRLVRVFET